MIKRLSRRRGALKDIRVIKSAAWEALVRLNPMRLYNNPVVFIGEMGAALVTLLVIRDFSHHLPVRWLDLQISIWLWLALYCANFIGALVEKGGVAQAEALLQSKRGVRAKLVKNTETRNYNLTDAKKLSVGDIILVEAGDVIPLDGEVIEGIASVDESAITGESAPVLRESGGSRSAVTGGTRVVSDFIYVEITVETGANFVDQMIDMVEGESRTKTPTEMSIIFLVTGLSFIFLMVTLSTGIFAHYSSTGVSVVFLVVLLSSLLPLPLGGLLLGAGTAALNRLIKFNVVAKSVRAVESAWDIGIILLDKTGTITLGNRIAIEFIPVNDTTIEELATKALTASFKDETPEGKSIAAIALSKYGAKWREPANAVPLPFSAHTRMSGVDYGAEKLRKGAVDVILDFVGSDRNDFRNKEVMERVEKIGLVGGTPLLVADSDRIFGVIHLKDVIKPGMKERFQRLRQLGVRTIMITGDNPLTAASIAAEAGVDDFIAEATPETKLAIIEREQANGRAAAMCGDGTNDAPALAKADIGLVMNSGTQAARDAGNMLDLDSDPTKLIEIITVGRQMLVTRGALTIFCLAGIIPKYLALLPALLAKGYPDLLRFNIMHLGSPESAVLSVAIFDALVIIMLLPVLVKGVKIKNLSPAKLLIENLILYGSIGVITPFVGIKLLDIIINALHMV